jgi:hypothetical protein
VPQLKGLIHIDLGESAAKEVDFSKELGRTMEMRQPAEQREYAH